MDGLRAPLKMPLGDRAWFCTSTYCALPLSGLWRTGQGSLSKTFKAVGKNSSAGFQKQFLIGFVVSGCGCEVCEPLWLRHSISEKYWMKSNLAKKNC